MSLNWPAVHARRLARHGLMTPANVPSLAEQTGVICGAHAQVMSAAELSLGLRVEGVTRTTVRDALWSERSLVKTYGPRGTIHLLPARDLPLWTGALSAAPAPRGGMPAAVRMSDEQTDAVVEAIASALTKDELTIDELSVEVIRRTGAWAGDLVMPAFNGFWPRWRQAITTAANRGVLCFGPNRGRNVTYTSPRRWLPDYEPIDPQTAIRTVVRHYLYAYGPATPRQFAQWFGASQSWAAQCFDDMSSELEQIVVDGTRVWMIRGDTIDPESPLVGVWLLPYFDAYTVGCHPRDLLFPGRARERALHGGQAGTVPTLVIDGVVAGVWHLRRSGRRLTITVEPFVDLTTRQQSALVEKVERIGVVLEGQPQLTIGDVDAGKHL